MIFSELYIKKDKYKNVKKKKVYKDNETFVKYKNSNDPNVCM